MTLQPGEEQHIGQKPPPLPGLTPYTRKSELQNAETSAWGRATPLGRRVHTGGVS